uniref:(northern house mosquito) hypothetical protein n=1 Tax=Culex pipiens TaxID=7175 RepID=A0A8D8AQI9_CULPI
MIVSLALWLFSDCNSCSLLVRFGVLYRSRVAWGLEVSTVRNVRSPCLSCCRKLCFPKMFLPQLEDVVGQAGRHRHFEDELGKEEVHAKLLVDLSWYSSFLVWIFQTARVTRWLL